MVTAREWCSIPPATVTDQTVAIDPATQKRSCPHYFLVLVVSCLAAHEVQADPPERPADRPSARSVPLPSTAPADDSAIPFVLPPVPEAPPEQAALQQALQIDRIKLLGNTVLPEDELQRLLDPYQKRSVTLGEIETLRQGLTQLYLDRGYINSGAVIDANAYADGTLTIRMVEGRLDEIRIKGTERLQPAYVSQRLWPDRQRVFNVHKLEDRYQRLLNDPLIARMNGELLPGDEMGHAALAVDVTRAVPYQLTLFTNNYRPPSIGSEAFGLNGVVRNLTGLGDALDFTFLTSGGSQRYAGGWTVPLSYTGTELFLRFDEGDSSVIEEPVQDLNIQSQVHSIEGGFSQPVLNRLNQRLTLGLSFGVRQNETSLLADPFAFLGGPRSEETQATVLRFFQDYLKRWNEQALAFRSTFSFGLNALGATPEVNPRDPDSEFFAWLGQVQLAQRLSDAGTQLVLRGNLQISDDPLLPLEQIAVGGVGTVRGYRENYLVRDNGFALALELRYPWRNNLPVRLALVPFFDVGSAWFHDPARSTDTLYSSGLGLEADYKALHVDFYYGHAFTNPLPSQQGDLQDDGLHFQARVDVF